MADKPIGELIDELDKLRDKVREILEKAKPFEEKYDALEKEILDRLLADKNDQARGKLEHRRSPRTCRRPRRRRACRRRRRR